MSQATDTLTMTPPGRPGGIAVSSRTYHGVTRSQIVQRAWQLAKLNRGNIHTSVRGQIGRWISHAWQEARDGHTENWTFLSADHEARSLEHQLTRLEFDNRRSAAHYSLMADADPRPLRTWSED